MNPQIVSDYQEATKDTAGPYIDAVNTLLPEGSHVGNFLKLAYCTLKLNGEAGEVAEKIGKALRDDLGVFTPERLRQLQKELGDVMWYVSQIHNELGLDLADTLHLNIMKLEDRKRRDVLKGSGSDR